MKDARLLLVFSCFLFEIFAIQNIPLPAPRRDMTRQGLDFLAHDFVDVVFPLKKIVQNLFRFCKCAALVRETCQPAFPHPIDHQMGQMRDATFRKTVHKINPFLAASFCLASRNIL